MAALHPDAGRAPMRSFGALLLAFFISVFVAGIVQNQIAVAYGAREEFIAVVMLFIATAIVAIVAFGIALAVARFSMPWGAVTALVLNVCAAAAGWLYWAVQLEAARMTHDKTIANALIFIAVGLVTSGVLIAWLRFTRMRTARR